MPLKPDLADFSGIDPRLFVKDALQKTYVDVNEEGTEAAVVTVIVTADESVPSTPKLSQTIRSYS